VADEFHGDEIFLISHETIFSSLLTMSAKLMIFNVIKFFMKLPLRTTLRDSLYAVAELAKNFSWGRIYINFEWCKC